MKKTILITGSATGIGLAAAFDLGQKGWRVVIHARNAARGQPALDSLRQADSSGDYSLLVGDLANLTEVRALANRVRADFGRLDVLWNNAGLMVPNRQTSADGWELQMAVNHLAPFVLTRALLPLLLPVAGRVICTSSAAHVAGRFRWDDWMDEGRAYSQFLTYSKTKLANILFTRELVRRFGSEGLTAHCFHPGFVRTDFGKAREGVHKKTFVDLLTFAQISPQTGCQTGVFLADTDLLPGPNGSYWSGRKPRRLGRLVNAEDAQQLWDLSERATLER
jgi:NAD(P)-dependent dehydrogenase (short-subunit alcohol dehydrogenase family)